MAGLADYFSQINTQTRQPVPMPSVQSGTQMVQDTTGVFTDPNSRLIQDARQRGYEFAQTRGGINSSIAAGAAEREALGLAQSQANTALNIEQQREARLWDEWATQQNFNRAMFGQLSQGAFSSTLNMLQSVQQYALEDPELYTPDVVSGYSEFFTRNFNDIFSRYFNTTGA